MIYRLTKAKLAVHAPCLDSSRLGRSRQEAHVVSCGIWQKGRFWPSPVRDFPLESIWIWRPLGLFDRHHVTSQKSTVFVEAAGGSKRKQGGVDQDSQTPRLAEKAQGVAFDGNELHYGCGSFERLALLIVLNASSRTDDNLDTKIAHEMKCNWFKDTQQLSRDRTSAGGVMGKEALVRKMLMPYVTGVGSGRERFKWPRRFCKECLR